MGVLTDDWKVQLAVDLQLSQDMWCGIGRTAAWADENNPPAESSSVTALDTPIGYKKVLTKFLVVPDPAGTLQFKNQTYKIINIDQAFTQNATRVYVEASFDYDEVPLSTFRQVGFFRRLVPSSGHELDLVLIPANVSSPGNLLYYDNRIAETRAIDKKNIVRRVFLF